MSRDAEFKLHVSVVRFLKTVAPGCLCFHVPNGERREPATGRRLAAMGTLAGAFDICVLAPGGAAYFIECKAGRGRLSASQEAFKLALIKLGFNYAIVRSLADVEAFVQQHLPNRLATQPRQLPLIEEATT
jgi:hypothetical protein